MIRRTTPSTPTPSAFRSRLLVPTSSGPKPLGSILAPFQLAALADLDEAFIALANGRELSKRQFYIEWTKGCAKTTLASVELLWLICFTAQPQEIVVGAGDADQASEVPNTIRLLVELNPHLEGMVEVFGTEVRRVKRDGQASAELRAVAANPLGIHGPKPTAGLIEEFVHVKDERFIDGFLSNTLKVNCLTVITTNAGHAGSFHERRKNSYLRSRYWTCHVYSQPAPWVSREEIDSLGMLPAMRDRLYFGKWVSGSDWIEESELQAALTLRGRARGPSDCMAYVLGADIGWTRDFSCACIVGVAEGGQVSLVDHKVWKPSWIPVFGKKVVEASAVREWIVQAHSRWGLTAIHLDRGGSDLWQECCKLGLPMAPEIRSGGPVYSVIAHTLLQKLKDRTLHLYDAEGGQLLNDLRALEIDSKLSGDVQLKNPRTREGGHSDLGMSFLYALYGPTLLIAEGGFFGSLEGRIAIGPRGPVAAIPQDAWLSREPDIMRPGETHFRTDAEAGPHEQWWR
jgi:hypothetical protein